MSNASVARLKENLSAYLRKVRKGEQIRVTLRGKVVAVLARPAPSKSEVNVARALLKGSILRYDRPFEPAIEPAAD